MSLVRRSGLAIRRARHEITSVALTYAVAVAIGGAMATSGNGLAIERRDAIVGGAQSSDILVAYRSGDRLRAAALDFAANLVLGGASSTALGVSVVGAYPVVAYRGWVGGIVSVDTQHQSRLADPGEALYYLVTLVLQLIPYSIAGGVGVRLGIASWRAMRRPAGPTWLGLPRAELVDASLAYVLIAPLFLVASLWEFLVR